MTLPGPSRLTVVGLVADTHLPRFGRHLPRLLLDRLAAAHVERILHLGDLTASFVVEQLAEIAPVEAVAGNNDPPDLVARFGTRRIVEIDGLRIGCTHGHLGPRRLTTPERARLAFADGGTDVIAFGHSHIPVCDVVDGVWLVNPGSPTDRRRQAAWSFGLLEIEDGRPRPRIVTLESRSP